MSDEEDLAGVTARVMPSDVDTSVWNVPTWLMSGSGS